MRRLGRFVTLAGLLLIAGTTMVPLPHQAAAAAAIPFWCLVCSHYGGVDVVLNVLLFIPFAFGLRLAGLPTRLVLVAGAALTLAIESLQFTIIPGRDASLSDLITNALGTLVGAGFGSRAAVFLTPTRGQARQVAITAGVAWLGLQMGTGFLLQPWVPGEQLWAEWNRTLPGGTPFSGSVIRAVVAGSTVLPASRPVDSQVSRHLRQGRIELALDLVSGRTVVEWAPVFELLGRNGPVVAVTAAGADLAFQPPARSYALRLRRPAIRLSRALPSSPGRSLHLTGGESRNTVWAAWTASGVRQQWHQALSPSFGWTLLLPFNYAYGPEVHLITGLWIAGLLAPISYWASRSHAARFPVGLGLLLLTGLGLIPVLTGSAAVHWSEWLAGAAGLGVGWASYRIAAYFGERCDSPSTKEFSSS